MKCWEVGMHLIKVFCTKIFLRMQISCTWSRTGNLVRFHRQPVVAGRPLLLELTIEDAADVPESEGADRRATDGVGRSLEDSVYNSLL